MRSPVIGWKYVKLCVLQSSPGVRLFYAHTIHGKKASYVLCTSLISRRLFVLCFMELVCFMYYGACLYYALWRLFVLCVMMLVFFVHIQYFARTRIKLCPLHWTAGACQSSVHRTDGEIRVMKEARYIYARRIEKGEVRFTNACRIKKGRLKLRMLGGWRGARSDLRIHAGSKDVMVLVLVMVLLLVMHIQIFVRRYVQLCALLWTTGACQTSAHKMMGWCCLNLCSQNDEVMLFKVMFTRWRRGMLFKVTLT